MKPVQLDIREALMRYVPNLICYDFLQGGKRHTIQGLTQEEYKRKHSLGRKKLAKVLRILRKSGYKYTDLCGRVDVHPAKYLEQIVKQGYTVNQVTMDDDIICSKADDRFSDIHGAVYDKDGKQHDFFFRFYNTKAYLKASAAIKPMLTDELDCDELHGIKTFRKTL